MIRLTCKSILYDSLLHTFYPNIRNNSLLTSLLYSNILYSPFYIIMFSIIGSNIIFNIVEYFSFINTFLLSLFIIISLLFIIIYSSLFILSTLSFNDSLLEFMSTLFSLLFLIIIISPALIILLDFDLIIIPSYIIYSLGLQWAWQFNLNFLPIDIGFDSYCDHYIISTINKSIDINILISSSDTISALDTIKSLDTINSSIINISPSPLSILYYTSSFLLITLDRLSFILITLDRLSFSSTIISDTYKLIIISDPLTYLIPKLKGISPLLIKNNLLSIRYLFDISQYILLPMYSFIRLFVYSFDVIHTLGFYSWGIKIDAIPGRINLATTLRLINKGEYRGKCFELCGQGHLSMFINTIVL
uniref:Cox2 n=1 Tax=Calcarina hispida TaxID=203399 RepID=UPI0023F49499|nr:Cox2 [Calcarina hispida]WEF49977.1 Cox2 [Calcarina hispida]